MDICNLNIALSLFKGHIFPIMWYLNSAYLSFNINENFIDSKNIKYMTIERYVIDIIVN